MRLAPLLPELEVAKPDRLVLTRLVDTLVTHNMEQYNTLLVTKDGAADSTRWKDIRKKDGFRVYRERASVTTQGPVTPQLLMLGTVDGTVEDVMYAVSAPTDEAMRIKSACVHDGMTDCKNLCDLVSPSLDDPFHHVAVRWRLFDARDYVTLDATGIRQTSARERIGFSLSHSVAFPQLPEFHDMHGVERGNMSVCALYRQKTPTTVECYIRGFFDFNTTNEVLSNLALQSIATQWLSFTRKMDCARMKKLVWKMRKSCGWTPTRKTGRTHSIADDLGEYVASSPATPATYTSRAKKFVSSRVSIAFRTAATSAGPSASRCAVCERSVRFLRGGSCKSCGHSVCARCSVKKSVCVLAPDQHTILEKKRTFCSRCIDEADASDPLKVAREELLCALGGGFGEEEEEDEDDGWSDTVRLSGWSAGSANSFLPSAVSRHSSIASMSSVVTTRSRYGSFA